MKWSSVEGTKGTYDYTNADSEVALATCSNMKVRGQNLVWATGAQTPAYATGDGTNSTANQALVTANIQEHIQSEVQHFGTKVYAWDSRQRASRSQPVRLSRSRPLLSGTRQELPHRCRVPGGPIKYAPAGTKLFINEYSTAPIPTVSHASSRSCTIFAAAVFNRWHRAWKPTTISTTHPPMLWSTPSTPWPSTSTASINRSTELDMAGVYNRRRQDLELRQQHTGIGPRRAGLALCPVL